jgi:hypothetical protein
MLAWAQSGQLGSGHLVWSAGMPAWLPAGQVQPFAALLAGYGVPSQAATRLGDDPLMRAILPVGRSGWAIAAGYLGLFAVLMLPAPFALATGVIAIVDIRKHPDRHGMGRAIFGVVMGVLFSAILVALLVSRH